MQDEAEKVINFWFNEIESDQWFTSSEEFDALVTERFGVILQLAKEGELTSWRDTPHGRLAEVLVLDQFSRNVYRGTAEAFSQDNLALALSKKAIELGDLDSLNSDQRAFLLLPHMHSESLEVHQDAQTLFAAYTNENTQHFEKLHKDIIDQFGRYPHRNQLLGRESSEAEIAFLTQPNSSF